MSLIVYHLEQKTVHFYYHKFPVAPNPPQLLTAKVRGFTSATIHFIQAELIINNNLVLYLLI